MIPEATLDQIQDRVDIVELIAASIPLRRMGKNFKANCPFHTEKTPSFIVNPDKQIFHCFGCGAGGNIFTFLMKFEKKDFLEVVESLAERTGVEIPKDKILPPAVAERRESLFKIHRQAAEFYHRFLFKETTAAPAREYLKKRGLTEDTLREFQIGFAPDSWDTLTLQLSKQAGQELLEKSGLSLVKKGGGLYDRFRNRILFPITDVKGQCVAFGGRVTDDSVPKYLNSPETEIYSKGRHLYGLHQGRQAVREADALIMVEGYMDVIACHQAGIRNAVASLGTALTPDQVRLVKRHTKNVFILYDADAAGESATLRGLELFLDEGLEVKIVRLPEGHDPDSYVRERGAAGFRKELESARTLFEYKLALLRRRYPTDSVENRVRIANEMVTLFSRVKNEILISAWTRELSKELALSEEAVRNEIRKAKDASGPARAEMPARLPARSVGEAVPPAEKILLGLMLENGEFIQRAKRALSPQDFKHPAVKALVEKLFEKTEPVAASRWMNDCREDAEAVRVLALAASEAERAPEKERAFEDCLNWMERSRLDSRREWLRSQIAYAEKAGDRGKVRSLLHDFSELNKGMRKNQ